MALNKPFGDNWEQGSEFHLLDYQTETVARYPWQDSCLCLGSGRDAIGLLLRHGMQQRRWLRLWIPGYFCQEVVKYILSLGIMVRVYNNNPVELQDAWNELPLKAGDVILAVNYFGLGTQPDYSAIDRKHVEIIEDHTHDPCSDWACNSQADWCIASLRKTLPVPDGGVLWSPQGFSLPEVIDFTPERKKASLEKLAGMVLKKYYLEGLPVQKQVFRNLAISGEENIAIGDISAMSPWTREMINGFPFENWRRVRVSNYLRFADMLKTCQELSVPSIDPLRTCPLSVPILFDKPGRRNYVRNRLIEHSIYPAILWELDNSKVEGISNAAIDISWRILCIHCDMRYDEQTMEYLAALIADFTTEFNGNG